MSAAHQRFNIIPRRFDGCIYAVEMSNGLVKVGYSGNPRTRMVGLLKFARLKLGAEITRFHIGPDMPLRAARFAEIRLIASVGKLGDALPGYREYFSGVDFADAMRLVQQSALAQPLA